MPAVTRLGDLTTGHPFPTPLTYPPMPSIQASDNVKANGLGIVRVGDEYANHGHTPDPPKPTLATGSSTVFVNGKPAGRVGDTVSCGDTVGVGSPNVNFG